MGETSTTTTFINGNLRFYLRLRTFVWFDKLTTNGLKIFIPVRPEPVEGYEQKNNGKNL